MTGWGALALALMAFAVVPGFGQSTSAQSTSGSAPQVAEPNCSDPAALGVSRTVEIDTNGGPRFGKKYADASDVLKDKEVVLTFDDGPARRYTIPILNALDAECVRATFFSVGRMALSDPETLREVGRRGHTIGTHTWSHKKLSAIGSAKSKDEIELGVSAVAAALGEPPAPFFRFPYLGDTAAMQKHMASRNIANVGIDIDSRDFLTRNPATVRKTVMQQLKARGRGIILFHDIQPSTAGALPTLLDDMKREGFKVVHLVAKTPVVTDVAYDERAAKEAARRKLALAKQPLSNRSVVWPASSVGSEMKPTAHGTSDLPWTKPADAAADEPQSPPARPRIKPSLSDDGWATRPLGQ